MSALALVVLVGLAAPLLAGCETASSIFGGSSPEMSAATPTASVVTSSTAAQAAYVAVTPVMGAPDNVSSMLGESIAEALEKQQISVAKGKDATAEYYLRGYVVAAQAAS